MNRHDVARPTWRLHVALVVAVLWLVTCGHSTVDYIDFIQHGDIQYVASMSGTLGRGLTDADLGAEQFRIRNALARGGNGGGGAPRDGDSAFVSAGEPVYALRGYRPSFRVAARHDGRLVLYEADSNPAAKVGGELLDLDGKVAAITLLSPKDGRTILGRIADPARVRELVSLVLTAPVDQSVRTTGTPVFIGFELTDGTVSSRAYFRDQGILHRRIRVSRAFGDAVDELRAGAPTATPLNLARRYDLVHATRVTLKGATSFRQNVDVVREFAAALDEDRPAFARSPSLGTDLLVIFEFPDHYVSLSLRYRGLDGPRPSHLSRELLVEMFLVERRGDDLRTITDRRFSYSAIERRDVVVAGHPALRLDGEFQNGRREYVQVQVDDQRVLVIGAFPSDSSRLGDFDRLLQYLVIG